MISGLKYFESRRGVPFKLYFISRYIRWEFLMPFPSFPHLIWLWLHFRVVPVQLVSIGMTVLLALLGSGPAFKYYYNKQIRNCDENMWKNLLFIANYDKYNLMVSDISGKGSPLTLLFLFLVFQSNLVYISRSAALCSVLFCAPIVG